MADARYDDYAHHVPDGVETQGRAPERLVKRLLLLKIETPSWGDVKTEARFGRFFRTAARTIIEKVDAAEQVHKLAAADWAFRA